MITTVFEGPRSSGKTDHLATCVVDRAKQGYSCWVVAMNDAGLEVIKLKVNKKLGATDAGLISYYRLGLSELNSLDHWKTEDICLFTDNCEYKPDLLDSLLDYKGGWREVFVTRTTGPEAAPQRTIH
jgi:hypothetical protein